MKKSVRLLLVLLVVSCVIAVTFLLGLGVIGYTLIGVVAFSILEDLAVSKKKFKNQQKYGLE